MSLRVSPLILLLQLLGVAALGALAIIPATFASTPAAPTQTVHLEAHDDGQTFWFSLAGQTAHNPDLPVHAGQVVTVELTNLGTSPHNLHVGAPVDQGLACCVAVGRNATLTFTVPTRVPAAGIPYWCEPHESLLMRGRFVDAQAPAQASVPGTTRHPAPGAGLAAALAGLGGVLWTARRRRLDGPPAGPPTA